MITIIDSYSETNVAIYESVTSEYIPYWGQSFTNNNGAILDSAKFYLKKKGSPTGSAVAEIYAHTGTYGQTSYPGWGVATGTALATSDNFDVTSLTTTPTLATFNFSGVNKITLSASTYYVIVLKYTGGDYGNNHILIGADNTSQTASGISCRSTYGVSWNAGVRDFVFYVYGELLPNPCTKIRGKCKIRGKVFIR
jgi:hypothetical protein